MGKLLKVAVIGAGFISEARHVPAWLKVKNCQIVAVQDVDKQRAEDVATKFRIRKSYDDLQELLEIEKPDIVDIVTPPKTHASVSIQALNSGANVLIEKPMAINVEECDEIIRVADAEKRSVCVAHSQLFYPPFIKARKLIKANVIGEFKGMRIFLGTHVDYMTSNPNHWANKLPGGVLGETGPHAVYCTLAFVNPINSIHIHGSKLTDEYPWSKYDDYRFDLIGQATSSVTLSYSMKHWASQIDLWGTEGMLKIDLETKTLSKYARPNLKPISLAKSALSEAGQIVQDVIGTSAKVLVGQYRNTHDLLIAEFAQSIVEGKEPPVTGWEGRESVRIMKSLVSQLG